MNKEYKVVKSDNKSIYNWQLYSNDELIKGYVDEKTAEIVKEKLIELDKLKVEAPGFGILLEYFLFFFYFLLFIELSQKKYIKEERNITSSIRILINYYQNSVNHYHTTCQYMI